MILVVAFHAGVPGVSGGFIGVDVFFVISGFVITGMLRREHTKTGRIGFADFYARRARRLLPALALLTTVVAVATVFLEPSLTVQKATAKTGLGATAFVANAVVYGQPHGYFGAEAALNPLIHTWTLSVEEQFYLVFPALLALGWARARRGADPCGRRDALLRSVDSAVLRTPLSRTRRI